MQSSLPELDAVQVLLALVAVPIIVILALMSRRSLLVMLGFLLFLACIGVARDWRGSIYGSWLLPLQNARNAVFAGLSVLLLIGAIPMIGNSRVGRVSFVAWMLLAIALFQGFMRITHEGAEAGLISMVFAIATIVPIMFILPAIVHRREDLRDYSFVVAVGFILFAGACFVQFAMDPSRLTAGLQDRFIGVAANPQHVAVSAAAGMIFAGWRIWGEPLQRGVPLWIGVFGLCGIAVLLTGSRTGLAMAAVGVVVLGYRRIGRSILILPVGVLLAFAALKIADTLGIDLPLARLTEGGDTRTVAWGQLISDFRSSPIAGVGMGEVEMSENSFLYAAATFGIGMISLMVLLAVAILAQCVAIYRVTRPYHRLRPTADFVIAFNLMYLFGANFEGYIMSRNSGMMVMLLISSSLASVLMTAIQTAETSGDPTFALEWGLDELVFTSEEIEAAEDNDAEEGESDDASTYIPDHTHHT
ncbi:MAG: hypothetical protein EXS10_10360 [Phycisphaerales bacterium]|nr:hypothetical protein [Phycisphaerales bacterium]